MTIKKVFPALFVLFLLALEAKPQSVAGFKQAGDTLSVMSRNIWKQKTDSLKLKSALEFQSVFKMMLEKPEFAACPFDSVSGITRVATGDGAVQIFTWNIPFSDGTFTYLGLVRLMKPVIRIVPLVSKYTETSTLRTEIFNAVNWYGALYYQLIETGRQEKNSFTLLGWDGYSVASNRKIIDVMTVLDDGRITFGSMIFNDGKTVKPRIIFEYGDQASMVLRYDYQRYNLKKGSKTKRVKSWLIVADHLVPLGVGFPDNRRYYVPSGETYEGYYFKNGAWNLTDNVEVRSNAAKKSR